VEPGGIGEIVLEVGEVINEAALRVDEVEVDVGRDLEPGALGDGEQDVFAAALGVSPSTVRAWEQGDRIPEGASRRLLQIAEEHPEYFAQMAQAAGK
jgi:hypothetical protein